VFHSLQCDTTILQTPEEIVRQIIIQSHHGITAECTIPGKKLLRHCDTAFPIMQKRTLALFSFWLSEKVLIEHALQPL
jgi:hypothetical protein